MPRPCRNLFYPVLGVVGFAFTITAASSCVSVLRGVRAAAADSTPHPLEELMDRHGTALLVGELVVLAIATVGAVGLDQLESSRERAARDAARQAEPAGKHGVDEP